MQNRLPFPALWPGRTEKSQATGTAAEGIWVEGMNHGLFAVNFSIFSQGIALRYLFLQSAMHISEGVVRSLFGALLHVNSGFIFLPFLGGSRWSNFLPAQQVEKAASFRWQELVRLQQPSALHPKEDERI